MPHFLNYLLNLNYRQMVYNGKDYMSNLIYNQVHDAMDADIIQSLEYCGFIYTSDEQRDIESNQKRHFFSFLKSLIVYLSAIKLLVLMFFVSPTSKWVLYLGDYTVSAGGIRFYLLLYFLFWNLWTIFVISLYHKSNSDEHYSKWLLPFIDLSEHFAIDREKKNQFFKFYKHVQRVFFGVKIANLVFCSLSFLSIYLDQMNLFQFVTYGIYSLIFNVYDIYIIQSIFFTSHLILYLIPYFVRLRFTFVNNEFEEYRHNIEDLHLKIDIDKLNVMLEHFNTLCREYIEYNNFISIIFGLNWFFITASSCLMLYLVFFTNLSGAYYFFYLFFLIFTFINCIFVPAYLAISAKHEAKEIYPTIFRLMYFQIPIKTKYNLLNIIEHQKDQRTGFSIFNFFQLNTYNFIRKRLVLYFCLSNRITKPTVFAKSLQFKRHRSF